MGRFINADTYASTGQGILGNNMFAYCLNNPVVLTDSSGTAAHIGFSADGQIHDAPWRIGSPGGGGWPHDIHYSQQDYGSVAEKFYTVRAAQFLGNQISNLGRKLREAYTQSYKMYYDTKILEAQLMIDMFDTPNDIERSIDIIEATVGLEIAVFRIVECSIINPAFVATIAAVAGAIWAARTLNRCCQ